MSPLVSVLRGIRSVLLALIVLALISVAIRYQAGVARLMIAELHMNDFGKFYYSARVFLEGGDMYGASPATLLPVGGGESRQFWNLNPPHFHLVMLPFAMLPPARAFLWWALLNGAALLAAVVAIARELDLRWSIRRALLTALIIAVLSPTSAVVLTGQMTCLLLLLMTFAWRWARRGRWSRAAAALGIAASLKPFLGVFLIYLAATRRPRAALAMASAGFACFAAGAAVFGLPAHAAWLAGVARADWTWAAMNGSLAGLTTRVLDASPYFTPLDVAPAIAGLLYFAGTTGVGVVSARILARPRAHGDADAAFAVLLLASLLASPLGWIYYLPLAAPPLVALWRRAIAPPLDLNVRGSVVRGSGIALLMSVPGLVLPVPAVLAAGRTAWGTMTFGSAYAWTTLLLWIAVVAHLSGTRRAG